MSLGNSTQGDFNVFQVTKPSGTSSTFDLELVAKGPQPVGFGTSSPIVTSNGTQAGSAIVWEITALRRATSNVSSLSSNSRMAGLVKPNSRLTMRCRAPTPVPTPEGSS